MKYIPAHNNSILINADSFAQLKFQESTRGMVQYVERVEFDESYYN